MILILENEPLIGMMLQDALTDAGIEAHLLDEDRDALAFIHENAAQIAGIIQDIDRHGSSERLPDRLFATRRKLERPMALPLDGGAFYLEAIDLLVPWTNVHFLSGFHGDLDSPAVAEHMRKNSRYAAGEIGRAIIGDWAARDPRISVSDKPDDVSNLIPIFEQWSKPRDKDLSKTVRFFEPANEEFAFTFASQPDLMHSMSPRKFEEFVSFVLENHGFRTELTTQTCDHGYDIRAVHPQRSNEIMLVEVKRYALRRKVEVGVIRALYGVKHLTGATCAMLVTSSFVSRYALREFSRTIPHELTIMDYTSLVDFCGKYASQLLDGTDAC